jgi:hypothetical protein
LVGVRAIAGAPEQHLYGQRNMCNIISRVSPVGWWVAMVVGRENEVFIQESVVAMKRDFEEFLSF